MVGSYSKKRKVQDGMQGKTNRPKKFRKQREYHSGSEDEQDDDQSTFKPVNLADSDEEDGGVSVNKIPVSKTRMNKTVTAQAPKKKIAKSTPAPKQKPAADEKESSDDNDAEDDDADEEEIDMSGSEDDDEVSEDGQSTTGGKRRAIPKRNDPSAFSTSISKILSTKLPASARADPVLSRSRYAAHLSSEWENEKLDNQARAKLRAEKKEELDRGRVRDVMGIERGLTGEVGEEEKRLRKTAQRGVVKLFNAVRAAQVRGEEAARDERKKGTVGMGEREKAVNEVSKQGFLELINGKKGKPLNIEEA
ncbi:Putative Ribosomal RNA-processing protein 15 [Penicillium brasilianum]|uniref:Putative Ribosomal RNA-processing protein 15 n=1 Tax=Penicillium brasilianum TaxID=104259 RepID=A0A0F7TY76_PENBI|nr:Putative Ribosomal RNA-processing protein 15 [Penicillium brasilianum]